MTKSKSRVCWRVWGKVLRIATRLCSPLLLFQQYRPLSQLPSTLQRWFNIFPYWRRKSSNNHRIHRSLCHLDWTYRWWDQHCHRKARWVLVTSIALHCIALVGIVGWVVHSLLGCKHKNISRTGTRHCQPEPRYLENQVQDTWKLEVCIRTGFS